MSRFFKLRTAMELRGAKDRHELAVSMMRDNDRCPVDQMTKHDRAIFTNYIRPICCKHIVSDFRSGIIKDGMIVRNANLFCEQCGRDLIKSNGAYNKKDRLFLQVSSKSFISIVDTYCNNIQELKIKGQDK